MTDSELDRLEPDSILPGQMRAERAWSPDERLWLGVLEDAWRCLNGGGRQGHRLSHHGGDGLTGRKARLAEEARLWFASPLTGPGSYIWVCEMLRIEPGRIVFCAPEPVSRVGAAEPNPHPNSLRGGASEGG